MGKRYYCEHCDKTMVAAPLIVKTHNKGVAHQKLVQDHYQKYKDPETILAEESTKKPCNRFARGDCQFGSICRYSHYTFEQINALKDYVASKNQLNADVTQLSLQDLYQKLQNEKCTKTPDSTTTVLYDRSGVTHVFPWVYNNNLDSFDNLPPSIKKMKTEDFVCANITEWG